MKPRSYIIGLLIICSSFAASTCSGGVRLGDEDVFLPSAKILERPFRKVDESLFACPPRVFYPEIWVDCLCGNLSKEGIHADLEAIHDAGFSGVQMFFGNRGGAWPGVRQIPSLSAEWEDFVTYAAEEAHRLGMRFTPACRFSLMISQAKIKVPIPVSRLSRLLITSLLSMVSPFRRLQGFLHFLSLS